MLVAVRALTRITLGPLHTNRLLTEMVVLLRRGPWLWVSAIFSILAVQLDVLVLSRMLAPALVGYYNLAQSLAFNADVVQQRLFAVLLLGLWWLVPMDGVMGAVLAKFMSRVAGVAVTLFDVRRAVTAAA
ncbi:MAG TPA: hypothetical protein VFG86_07180 [Chloroflexota bacterium]|jgi:O-antigen/teichoic acid export membrane protein|nr:hypothetical protein [Chloroflexota bacterium]